MALHDARRTLRGALADQAWTVGRTVQAGDPGCDDTLEASSGSSGRTSPAEPAEELSPDAAAYLQACPGRREDDVGRRELMLVAAEWPAGPG